MPTAASSDSDVKARMAGHKRIRLLCLPIADSSRLHMEAPIVYSIAGDQNERRFAPISRVSQVSRASDLRREVKQSTKNLFSLGSHGPADTSGKRVFDVFMKAKKMQALGAVAESSSGDPARQNWKKIDLRALSDGLVSLGTLDALSTSAAVHDVGHLVEESVKLESVVMETALSSVLEAGERISSSGVEAAEPAEADAASVVATNVTVK